MCGRSLRFHGLLLGLLAASSVSVAQENRFSSLAGIDSIPSINWDVKAISDAPKLSYRMETNSMTSYIGALVNRDLGFSLGINAAVDHNAVEKAYRYSAYIGMKRLLFRVQDGSLNGTATWNGGLVGNQKAVNAFKNRYTNVDLLYRLGKRGLDSPMYIGLGYTSFKVPMQIDTLVTNSDKANQKNGVPTFDPDYEINAYSFLFGFDLMLVPEPLGSRSNGFGLMLTTQDRIGLGNTQISEAARVNAGLLNPGKTPVSGKMLAGLVDFDISAGLRYTFGGSRFKGSAAVGYNFGYTSILNLTGAATNPTELGYEGSFEMKRHGLILRAFFYF